MEEHHSAESQGLRSDYYQELCFFLFSVFVTRLKYLFNFIIKLEICHISLSVDSHNTFDIAGPSNVGKACNM